MRIKWGIIGCGDVAEYKGGPALYQIKNSELIAVMRRDIKKAMEFAQRHRAKRFYGSVEELLRDKEINAVYVATPVYLHYEQVIKAAEAGKHILCEKPMAMNVAQCQRMIQRCKEKNVKLMIAYYRRFYPHIKRMRNLIETGAIGKPILARVSLSSYYNPTVPRQWRIDPSLSGGGVLMDVGSHRIDLLIYLLGKVEKVSAFVETIHCDYLVEDSVVMILKFKNGAQGMINFNWNIRKGVDELEIYGIKGKILAKPDSGNLEIHSVEGVRKFALPSPKSTHLGVIEDFVKSIQTGKEMACSGKEGMKTNQVIQGAYESSKKGKAISLKDYEKIT